MNTHLTNLQTPTLAGDRLEPEDAQLALEKVQTLLKQQHQEALLLQQQNDEESSVNQQQRLQSEHEAALAQILAELHPADAAYLLDALPLDQRAIVWDLLPQESHGEVLLEVSEAVRETLIRGMDRNELVDAVETLEADEIADLVPDLPPEVVEQVRQGLSLEEREQLRAAMSYPEDSVGARMDFELLTARHEVSLEIVLRYLRRFDQLPDQTDQVFIVDDQDILLGSLPISRLLVNEPEVLVTDVMQTDILTLAPLDDASEAAQAFSRYDLVSAAVVDPAGKLVGRLTVNEVVDVIREDSDEQALSKAGLSQEDIFAPLLSAISNRAPWLLVNLCTASMAAFVASRFEQTVSHIVILAFLMSIVAGIGGNSGNQTMTLIIRALALGRITPRNLWHLIRHELAVSVIVSATGGALAGTVVWIISKQPGLGLVMMAAMMLNLIVGTIVGIVVPLTRARFGKDPALGSSVLLTFVTDSMGFFIFLGLATLFLL